VSPMHSGCNARNTLISHSPPMICMFFVQVDFDPNVVANEAFGNFVGIGNT
jgi:hypothetical protein